MSTPTLFSKEAKKILLTASERNGLREQIVSYMAYHPLQMPVPASPVYSGRYTKYIIALFGVRLAHSRMVVGALALIFFITVPFVAEQSLPGDTLYPIKVRFNEGIRSQLLFSPYEKMQWETRRVERRIAEARLLVKEGKLTAENESMLEETIRSHTTAFQAQLETLRDNDATSAVIAEVTLESALDVQSVVLNADIAQEAFTANINERNVSGLATIVQEARNGVTSPTDTVGNTASYEPLVARIEENTTRIHALLQELTTELTEVQKIQIEERMNRVGIDFISAKEARGAGKDDVVIPLLRSVLATTEKLIAFMSNSDVWSNVSLDILVPQPIIDDPLKMQSTNTKNSTPKSETPTPALEKVP